MDTISYWYGVEHPVPTPARLDQGIPLPTHHTPFLPRLLECSCPPDYSESTVASFISTGAEIIYYFSS